MGAKLISSGIYMKKKSFYFLYVLLCVTFNAVIMNFTILSTIFIIYVAYNLNAQLLLRLKT